MMTGISFKMCRLAVPVIVAMVLIPALPLNAVVTYDTRALTGDTAPGTTRTYRTFYYPLIDASGQVAFRAITNAGDRGIWSEGSGSLSLVALHDEAAPGTTGVYNFLDTLEYNSVGKTAFFSSMIVGTGGVTYDNNTGIWSNHSGSLSLILRERDATPSGVFAGVNSIAAFNDAGHIVSIGALEVGTGGVTVANDMVIWSTASGAIAVVAREGSAAPGAPGAVFSGDGDGQGSSPDAASFGRLLLNGSSQTAFAGGLLVGTGGVTLQNDGGIWSEGSGSLALVVREGSAAPGTIGAVYDRLETRFDFNDAGTIAFKSTLVVGTGDVTEDNKHGIWTGRAGSVNLLVRSGDAAPGVAGATFLALGAVLMNGADQTAFHARLTGPGVTIDNDGGIWSERLGSLGLVTREGSIAPGTDGVFCNFGQGGNNLILNGRGQVAFHGRLKSGTVTLANNQGIWATDLNGQLQLIVRKGDVIDVNDDPLVDDFRTIAEVYLKTSYSGGEDGQSSAFNDEGQIAFWLKFTNDSSQGIFVANMNTLRGDLDGDGFVGIEDLNVILQNWDQTVSVSGLSLMAQSSNPITGDLDGNGRVGIEDLNVVLGNWNAGALPVGPANGVANIPEPGTMVLLGLMGVSLIKRSCRA